MTDKITNVVLDRSPTELYKILKFEGLVSSGAEAKLVIASGLVKVNGEIETRKRKKIIAGNVIEFDNNTLVISV
jgi:ribosome-associated protein